MNAYEPTPDQCTATNASGRRCAWDAGHTGDHASLADGRRVIRWSTPTEVPGYGSPEHEAQLIELERTDVPDERPDQPWTPCGCTARAYGGDCAHTIDDEGEEELHAAYLARADCGRRHIGYSCTLAAGHTGLHRSRGTDGILRHSWAAR